MCVHAVRGPVSLGDRLFCSCSFVLWEEISNLALHQYWKLYGEVCQLWQPFSLSAFQYLFMFEVRIIFLFILTSISTKNMSFQASYCLTFYIAAAPGGKTWCRAQAAENFSALWGEMPAMEPRAFNIGASPTEETTHSPGWEENEGYWEGTGDHGK